jgi:Leucine-rich repeat (LRR) protein
MDQTITINVVLLDKNGKTHEKDIKVKSNHKLHNSEVVEVISIGQCETLTKVDFSSNSIEKLGKNLFDSCSNLREINFSYNKLQELDEQLFAGCNKNLERIAFGWNEIGDLNPGLFSGCVKLNYIRFNNNKIQVIKENLFSECKDSLADIDFSFNEIENIPNKVFEGCTNLVYAFFNMNKIKKLDGNLFKYCKNILVAIGFAHNQIDQLGLGLFDECSRLETISLNNNKITELNKDIFRRCGRLTKINFSCNRLKDTGNLDFSKVTFRELNQADWDIIDINFSNNFLTSFPYFFIDPKQKFRIDFRDNLNVLDYFQLLFRKLDKNNRDQEHIVFPNVDDYDIVLDRQRKIKPILFLIFLNSKIFNIDDDEIFKTNCTYLNNETNKDMTVLDFLILLGNESFSNDNLIHLNDAFETEKKKNPHLKNFEFLIKKPDSIEALCQRNDYATFKKIFNLNKLDDKVEKPKEFIRSINFLKCFDIALKNDNEKIAIFLLKILSFYTFNSKIQVKDSRNISKIDKIDDKFNEEFTNSNSLNKLDIIKLINTLSEFFIKNPKKEKYRDKDGDGDEKERLNWDWDRNWNITWEWDRNWDRNWDRDWDGDGDGFGNWNGPKEKFEGGYKLFLDMERIYFKDTFDNFLNEIYNGIKSKTFNEIFLKIYLEAFFHLEWFEAIEFLLDQCKKYTEVESKIKKDNKNKNIKGNVKKDGEFLPFFCFNEIGYIKRLQKKKKNNKVESSTPISTENPITEPVTVPFSPFFIFKLVKNIEDESIRKKFLNHKAFLNLVKMEWHSIVGLIYYLKLLIYLIFLVFYSINIEIYPKSNASSSPLNLSCKVICFVLLFIFWFIEILQLIFYATESNVFGYILNFKNSAEFINFPLCIFSLFYDIFGSNIEVKSAFYTITILISYYILLKRLDKISFLKIGAKINVISKIIRKSMSITILLLIAAIAFILSFRNRSTYYEMSGLGGDDLTQMSNFNTTFEFNLFQILQFGLGGIATSQMGIDMIQGSNFVNYVIYGCFIFIMPIMFFNILTAISLDAIGDMMKNASDNIILNKIEYFEVKEFYQKFFMECREDQKIRNWIGKITIKINKKIKDVLDFISDSVFAEIKEFWYRYLKNKENSKTEEEQNSGEENLNLAKSIEKNKEYLISMIKSLSNKVEIRDRELEDKFSKINDKIEQNVSPSVQFNKNNDIDQKFDKIDKNIKEIIRELEDKFNKINDKIEQNVSPSVQFNKNNDIDQKFDKIDKNIKEIITALNQLNNKRKESKTRKNMESTVNYGDTPSKTDSGLHPPSKQDTK